MKVHGIRHMLTFNVSDFANLEGIIPFAPGTSPAT